jgi:site-specific DNA-methyltransferase (adenine-specific)
MHYLYHGDCLHVLEHIPNANCIFADPPDNIKLGYSEHNDNLPDDEYVDLLDTLLQAFVGKAPVVWMSYNSKWSFAMGMIVWRLLKANPRLSAKNCIQTFTFGQHNHHDFGNNHRPLLRLWWPDAAFYPDAIRVPSWRQENGDKRADPRGRVPGDVFDFPRVTGNSKQRRPWCPTQLNEGLVERCLLFSTKMGDTVIDPFAGTGTTLRVCERIGRSCTLIDLDSTYCRNISEEHGLPISRA